MSPEREQEQRTHFLNKKGVPLEIYVASQIEELALGETLPSATNRPELKDFLRIFKLQIATSALDLRQVEFDTLRPPITQQRDDGDWKSELIVMQNWVLAHSASQNSGKAIDVLYSRPELVRSDLFPFWLATCFLNCDVALSQPGKNGEEVLQVAATIDPERHRCGIRWESEGYTVPFGDNSVRFEPGRLQRWYDYSGQPDTQTSFLEKKYGVQI